MAQDPELLRRLLRARDRMDAASHEGWPVARLARVSGVSQAHFARSFKEAFGVPPHRYLLTRRIARACMLLRDTDLPILEIALRTGWRSPGTFGRTFRSLRFVRCGVVLAYGRAGLRIGAVAGHPRVGRRRVTGGVKCDHWSAPPGGGLHLHANAP